MRSLFLLIGFTICMSACGGYAWDGDPAACMAIVDGACSANIPGEQVTLGHRLSQAHFGPSSIEGYLITRYQTVGETPCQPTSLGCIDRVHRHIYVILSDRQLGLNPWLCSAWVIGHEAGHIALPDDDNHLSSLWGEWRNRQIEVCLTPG